MKKAISLIILLTTLPIFAAFNSADYSEAMQMAVKFFGGQRCGDTHNWMLVNNPDPKTTDACHMEDAWQGHDVTGGWHDCGDHIKVAVTMGYAAICLLSAYDIWPTAFEDDHAADYTPGPNGIPDVLDEVKIATDYFMKCLIDGTTFVYYVGNDKDHERWVTSSYQSTLGPELGGDPRPTAASDDAGGPQAADYATALALMAMHYPDETYREKCKEMALLYYTFAKKYTSNINIPTFYSSPSSEVSDEYALASITMYRLTKDQSYKDDAVNALSNKWESNSALAWDTKTDIAYYYLTVVNPNSNNGDPKNGTFHSFLRKNVASAMRGANSYGIPWGWFKSNWGTNKLACGSAYPAALYAKLINDGVIEPDSITAEAATEFNRKIIDYMLGDNEFNHPFIHGYKGDMTFKVHHRNAMGNNELNFDSDAKNNATFLFASGALIGGPVVEGQFQNIVEGGNAFMETESGCDYNGPFVAALANIVAKLDPKTGTRYHYQHWSKEQKRAISYKNGHVLANNSNANHFTICSINGSILAKGVAGKKLHLPAGFYLVRTKNGVNTTPIVVP